MPTFLAPALGVGATHTGGNVTAQSTSTAQVQIGALGPAAEAAVLLNDASIYRSASGQLATRNMMNFGAMSTSSTTAYAAATMALTFQNRSATANNYTELGFYSANTGLAAGVAARVTDHTNHYGELWFHGRSPAGLFPRVRVPSTGGMDIYGDANAAVASFSNASSIYSTLGADVLTNGGFTGSSTGWTLGANWAWSADKITHTPGSTAAVTQALTGLTSGAIYLISVTITGATTGFVTVDLGGNPAANMGITASSGVRAPSATPTLTITPSSGFDGAIDTISLQRVSGATHQFRLLSSAGSPQGGVVMDNSLGNFGLGSGVLAAVSAIGNANNSTAMGNGALGSLVGAINNGIGNTAFGSNALPGLVWGNGNVAVGYGSLAAMTYGGGNTAIGNSALNSLLTGVNNSALGSAALLNTTTGNNNTAAGGSAGQYVTTGWNNTMLGLYAGVGNNGTSTNAVTTGNSNVFIGLNSRLGGTTQRDNMVVIGNAARGDGSPATAIGVNASAGAAGSVAIGSDNTYAAATTTTANEFMFGTSLHTYQFPGSALSVGGAISTTGLTGATAASRLVGATASGKPATGTFAKGDVVVDQTGKLWVNTTAGSPGTWTDASSAPSFYAIAKWGVD